jgi:hypothetical protein
MNREIAGTINVDGAAKMVYPEVVEALGYTIPAPAAGYLNWRLVLSPASSFLCSVRCAKHLASRCLGPDPG